MGLVVGRGEKGPEPHSPNTLFLSCPDGQLGVFHEDESLDRLSVSTLDGSPLESGKTARIEADVWAWGDGRRDSLDLFYVADVNHPDWVYLTTLYPQGGGAQVLSTTYTLPVGGSVQAIRGSFRYFGAPVPCDWDLDTRNDHDDLAFAVGGETASPPVASFTYSCAGLACSFTDASTDPDGTITGYSWAFGDGYGATLKNPSHTFAAAGAYTVSLTVTDGQGLTTTTLQTVVATDPPPPVITLGATGLKAAVHR